GWGPAGGGAGGRPPTEKAVNAAIQTAMAAHCRWSESRRARHFTESLAAGELEPFFEHRVRARGFRHQETIAERDHFLHVVGFGVRVAARDIVFLAVGDHL